MPTWAFILIYIACYLFILIFVTAFSFLAIKKCKQGKQSGVWLGLLATLAIFPFVGAIPFWILYNKNSNNKKEKNDISINECNMTSLKLKQIELEDKIKAINKNSNNKSMIIKFKKEASILEKEIEEMLN
ncbi:unknown transmembrane protein [Mesoplasma florum L1]|uniref:Uncharacterized protein n=1 Tax=Mesoplasma florum (strain ATCC 33453 / NBRC 100688 / NCTC 11704 / L1) TaxID=265311 RepID=Q6F0X9_MESFL|nr:hypothetical protein [Mesoplasma florum]AAT75844.1 unknown transmembrane protein [Mesoplasma florum L1]ATI73452.1 hypothetical protein CQZ69_02685 [Mesoplasma florum]AVN61845.1 hypothetical protein CG004_02670 [Mesoplasma florum]